MDDCRLDRVGASAADVTLEAAHGVLNPAASRPWASTMQALRSLDWLTMAELVGHDATPSPQGVFTVDASPEQILRDNRQHWCIENSCHDILDWNYDEDRSRIRKGYGPQNMIRLRRFAIGVVKSKGVKSVAQTTRQLMLNLRRVFDYLKMTDNACRRSAT